MNPKNNISLIACGGQSTRMGQDKGLLTYHQKPQRYHLYDLLSRIHGRAHLSINPKQESAVEEGYAFITDLPEYENTGPVAGLLSAFARFPGTNILYIGCDYPFLNEQELVRFRDIVSDNKPAAFYNEPAATYEPLLAWYPSAIAGKLFARFRSGHHSLREFLEQEQADKHIPENQLCLFSADTPEDFKQVVKQFHNLPSPLKSDLNRKENQ